LGEGRVDHFLISTAISSACFGSLAELIARLSAPCVQQIGRDIVPARDLSDARFTRQALLDDPSLFRRRPSPAPLGPQRSVDVVIVCPLICKLMGTQAQAQIS